MLPLLSLLALSAVVTSVPSALALVSSGPRDVESLFRRQTAIPEVGSAEWVALYPAAGSTPTTVPQAWTDALAAAVAAGKIPDLPPATLTQGYPSYSNNLDPAGPVACHNTRGCSIASDKLVAPDGMIGISQDDGPLPPGRTLNSFFEAQKINATHFYIGGNVLGNYDIFLQARAIPGQHFAVHTWTHPYMSSLSNEGVVAELGWTMQILADSNYGKIPAHWRPPFGDVDNRVRAIAKEVFGLQTIIWGVERDSEDWTLTNLDNEEAVKATITGFLEGPKAPGMIMLQHELSDRAVNAFITLWPSYLSNGWDCRTIVRQNTSPFSLCFPS
ncbi:hypothetical protein BDY24DRAFT_88798 [Mrakia frigida]|uniref:uncharacterized protein n=1 Tax=Mrakia frigida TaxID=29902 RepID=UPI003FCC26BD